jgi:hypothetical protein
VFRKQRWSEAALQPRQVPQVRSIERSIAADRQADAVDGQGALAHRIQIAVRWAAGAHVVFGMDFEKAHARARPQNRLVVLGLQADASPVDAGIVDVERTIRAHRVFLVGRRLEENFQPAVQLESGFRGQAARAVRRGDRLASALRNQLEGIALVVLVLVPAQVVPAPA